MRTIRGQTVEQKWNGVSELQAIHELGNGILHLLWIMLVVLSTCGHR